MKNKGMPYVSFLLRLWLADGQDGAVWRAWLRPTQGEAEHVSFGSLHELYEYLDRYVAAFSDAPSEVDRAGQARDSSGQEKP